MRQHGLHLRTQLGRLNEGAGFLDCHVLDIREPVISHFMVCGAAIHTHSTGCRWPELYAEGKSGADAAQVGRSHISESLSGQPSRIRSSQPLLLPFWCCGWNPGLRSLMLCAVDGCLLGSLAPIEVQAEVTRLDHRLRELMCWGWVEGTT